MMYLMSYCTPPMKTLMEVNLLENNGMKRSCCETKEAAEASKTETRDNLAKEEILQDDRFFVIAGYTSGGAPYGVTWEEMGLKPWEDLEENN